MCLLFLQTAILYYNAAIQYGTKHVKKTAFNWLLVNLLSFYSKHNKWLQLISADLLTDLITCPDLVVIQTEFALYALLKVWVYLKLHPEYFDETDNTNRANDLCNQSCLFFEQMHGKYTSYILFLLFMNSAS